MINFESNAEALSLRIQQRAAQMANLSDALTKSAAQAVSTTKRRFRDNDWAANAASTIRRKGSDRPGINTGKLRQSIAASDLTENSISIGTNVAYAKYLQFGTRDHERGSAFVTKQGPRARAHHGAPARPFLYFDDPLRAKIVAIFRKTLFSTAGGE